MGVGSSGLPVYRPRRSFQGPDRPPLRLARRVAKIDDMLDRRVSLFIPCLIDQVLPEIGFDLASLLERLGYRVEYDPAQTCCGQPAFNAGHRDEALPVARHFVETFRDVEKVVCPSGSCVAMVRQFYPLLFQDEPDRGELDLPGGRVQELSEFLASEGLIPELRGRAGGRLAFHNSCHSQRELGLGVPRAILERIEGCEWVTPPGEPTCCGFGGLFSVKHPDIAGAMATTRLEQLVEAGAERIITNDPGCLQHLRGEIAGKELDVTADHLVTFLEGAMRREAGES